MFVYYFVYYFIYCSDKNIEDQDESVMRYTYI